MLTVIFIVMASIYMAKAAPEQATQQDHVLLAFFFLGLALTNAVDDIRLELKKTREGRR